MPAIIPFLPAIIGGVGSVVGGALSKKSSSGPTTPPAYAGLEDLIRQITTQRLSTPTDMAGYAGTGVANINRTYDLAGQSLANRLTARGLATSPVAASGVATLESGRAGDISTFQNSIPLLQRMMQGQDLAQAGNVLQGARGQQQTSGGGAAGAFENLAEYLGYMQGKGAFKKGGGGSNPLSGGYVLPGTY